jgi:hypothetical protein
VRPKLLGQVALGEGREGEDNQAASIPVDPVHRPDRRVSSFVIRDEISQFIGQSRRQVALGPRSKFGSFFGVAHRCDARRFINHDDVGVDEADREPSLRFGLSPVVPSSAFRFAA